MDSSRPSLTPTKSHEDAFMDALLEGLGPTDFAFSSPSPPQKSNLSQTADLCQFRSTEDGSLPHKGPARSQNVSTSLSKGPRRSADRSSKCASQLPEVKRQGSLMQYAKRPQPSQSSSDAKIVAQNLGYDVKARSAKRASPHCKITKTDTYIEKNTPSISTSAEAHRQASCASPPLAGLFVRMHQSPVRLPTKTIARHLPITFNSQRPLQHCQEDYAALFSGLEEGWDAVSDDESEQQPKPPPLCQQYTKCVVSRISPQPEWNAANRRLENRIEVTLESITGPVRKTLLLCDDWAETRLKPTDEMNLVSLPGSPALDLHQDVITFSRSEPGHLIILIPSLLISVTVVAIAPSCPRRGVLNDRIRNSQNEIGEAVIRGTIVHEVIQNMLLPNEQTSTDEELSDTPDDIPELWKATRVLKEAKDACMRHVSDLLTIQQTVEQGVTMVTEHLKELPAWSSKYIVQEDEGKMFKIKKEAHLLDPRSCVKQDAACPKIGITAVCDVEEEIWSPKFGLKGKIDVTVRAAIIEDPQTTDFFQADELVTKRTHLLPLEIKTGRRPCGVEHTAQTMLYTLLMSDRYNVDISAGLLFYTSFNELTRVQAVKAEIRHLIIARNQLASYIHKRAIKHQEAELLQVSIGVHDSSNNTAGNTPAPDIERTLLPEPIDNPQTCSRCYAVESCMLFRKTIEEVDEIPFQRGLESLQAMYQDKTEHLTPIHSAFFSRWESLVSLEERELGQFKKEIWELTAEKRQRYGRAFADMVIDESFDSTQWSETAKSVHTVHRYTYCLMSSIPASSTGSPLKSQTCAPNVLPTQSLLTSQIGVGDPIVVSIEGEKLAVAKGFVCELTPYHIVIGVDHRLDNPGPVPVGSIIKKRATQHTNTPKILFRVDKDELMAGMGRLRDNLAQLFYADGDYKRRELVVDLRPPEFDVVLKTGQDIQFNHLNEDQRSAIDKVMSAKDYALILGMPGTGKTTTIAEVIKALIKNGKSVLLTSYTHSAVDNILSKLISSNINMLRLGNIDKISSVLHRYTLDETQPWTTVEALEERLMSPPLVATTCLSINHPLFKRRKFDYCIVDEASQITLPTILGPLRFARTFVLVGDHFQLPPLVKNPLAKVRGLETSLFKLLSETHPDAMVALTQQYRMNEDIMSLSNALIYDGRLRCANDSVSQLVLEIPRGIDLEYLHSIASQTCANRCWLADILAPERRVVFVDTDKIESQESKMGTLVQNGTEADLVVQIVTALLRGGVSPSEIGVITPYRQQIKLLVYLLEHAQGVEIITADKAQGRDKACVIMTMVRSNKDEQVGQLLRDWRRINVCLTRARQKLIILGSRQTLECSDILRDFLALVEARKWIYDLQPGDESAHQSMSSASSLSYNMTVGGLASPLLPLKRKSSSPAEKISPGLRNIRKTHTVLKDLTTHILMEGESI